MVFRIKGIIQAGWEQKQKRLEQEGRAEEARMRVLSRELDWVRAAPKARQAKSKARLTAYEQLLEQNHEAHTEAARISIPPGPRLGNIVIEADGLRKGFQDKQLIDGLDFRLPPGGIVGGVGPNGAGKTTLFRMLTDQDTPDEGSLRVGETVQMAYVDQSRDALDDNKTVWEVISDGNEEIELGKRVVNSRAYVGQFNFKGSDQQKKVGQLSGGERNRVCIWHGCSNQAVMSCSSMSRQTTLTWIHCGPLKKLCLNLVAVPL